MCKRDQHGDRKRRQGTERAVSWPVEGTPFFPHWKSKKSDALGIWCL